MRGFRLLCATGLLAAAATCLAAPAEAALLRYEYASAHRYLARVQMLVERLSKENLLSQLNLAPERRSDVVEATAEIDKALVLLRNGSPLLGVPRPPTAKIVERLEDLEQIWAPMRRSALTNPYRLRPGQFGLPATRKATPTVLLRFEERVADVVDSARGIAQLYLEECKKDGYPTCDLDIGAGSAHVLSEQIVKDAVFVYADINSTQARTRLMDRMETFERTIHPPPEVRRFLEEAMSFERGDAGEYVRELQGSIEATWPRLRRETELVAEGHAQPENLLAAVRHQVAIADDLERLTVAMLRFSIIEQGASGLLALPSATPPPPDASAAP